MHTALVSSTTRNARQIDATARVGADAAVPRNHEIGVENCQSTPYKSIELFGRILQALPIYFRHTLLSFAQSAAFLAYTYKNQRYTPSFASCAQDCEDVSPVGDVSKADATMQLGLRA